MTASADGTLITVVCSDDIMLVDASGKSRAPVVVLSADRHRVPGRSAAAVRCPGQETEAEEHRTAQQSLDAGCQRLHQRLDEVKTRTEKRKPDRLTAVCEVFAGAGKLVSSNTL